MNNQISLSLTEQTLEFREIHSFYAPYSKMAENALFFCLHVNWHLLARFTPNIPLNSADEIEATRAS